MITLIGDLMINEYQMDAYKIRITIKRETAELLSIVLNHKYLGQDVIEIYEGKIANELYQELLVAKMSHALGLKEEVNFSRFSRQGSVIQKEGHS